MSGRGWLCIFAIVELKFEEVGVKERDVLEDGVVLRKVLEGQVEYYLVGGRSPPFIRGGKKASRDEFVAVSPPRGNIY